MLARPSPASLLTSCRSYVFSREIVNELLLSAEETQPAVMTETTNSNNSRGKQAAIRWTLPSFHRSLQR